MTSFDQYIAFIRFKSLHCAYKHAFVSNHIFIYIFESACFAEEIQYQFLEWCINICNNERDIRHLLYIPLFAYRANNSLENIHSILQL